MRSILFVLAFSLFSGLQGGDTIRLAVKEWTSLNPLLQATSSDPEPVDLLFDRLITLDSRGEFIPELLESWTILQGGREVLLKLRPGMTWHDGRPIEAEDVVFTWKALRLPRVRALADTASGVVSLDSLTAEGPLTVRIRLKRPRGSLLSDLYTLIPVPRHHYQVGANPAAAPVNFAPVGSGPYRAVGKATSRRIYMERWEGYRGAHPGKASAFELWDAREERKILAAFNEERLHYSPVDSLHHYLVRKGIQGMGVVQALSAPQATFGAYFLNCDPQRSLLGDVTLRQALAEVVPWQSMARARKFFPGRLATGFWPPESWAYDGVPRPLPNPDRAVSILDAAGWKLGPDGIRRDAKGRRLALVAYESGAVTNLSLCHMLAAQAAKVGILIDVRVISFNAVIAKSASHDGDIWTYDWSLSLDPDLESPLFTREGYQTGANVSGYLNPEMDRLFNEGRHALDLEVRKRIYHEISKLIYRDKPVIPIDYLQTNVLVHRRLKGVAFNQIGQSFGFWPGRRGWVLVPKEKLPSPRKSLSHQATGAITTSNPRSWSRLTWRRTARFLSWRS